MTADTIAAIASGVIATLLLAHNIVLQRRASRYALAVIDAANVVASMRREIDALRAHVDKLHEARQR